MEENKQLTLEETIKFLDLCIVDQKGRDVKDELLISMLTNIKSWLEQLKYNVSGEKILSWLDEHAEDYVICATNLGRTIRERLIPDLKKVICSETEASQGSIDENENPNSPKFKHVPYEYHDEEGRYIRGFNVSGPHCRCTLYFYCDEEGQPLKSFYVNPINPSGDSIKIFKDLYLSNLFVDPEYRRRGLARLILNRVQQFAKDNGFSDLFLWVEEDSWIKDWYIRNGFNSCYCYKEDTAESDRSANPQKYLWMRKSI